ncbi:hypothetical protein KIPB_004587 [Kipferlia bialata]|uniref:Uncharacterized protein n=1 Tax=Kipferlia bialata TaxID=797122 RepID=A0A9K3CVX5_9EUKA|nr:hypothetical protein KIPB_004587 [Kipferlia bialata]|eukprot:g4587.t1
MGEHLLLSLFDLFDSHLQGFLDFTDVFGLVALLLAQKTGCLVPYLFQHQSQLFSTLSQHGTTPDATVQASNVTALARVLGVKAHRVQAVLNDMGLRGVLAFDVASFNTILFTLFTDCDDRVWAAQGRATPYIPFETLRSLGISHHALGSEDFR